MITLKTFLVAGVAARLAGVRNRIGSVSGLGFFFISNDFKTRLSRWLYRPFFLFAMANKSTEVIFQNDDDRKLLCDFAKIDKQKTHLIPGSGVDLTLFKYVPEPPVPVVFVLIGRMLKDKGVLEFVQAANILLKQGVQARFVLAGLPDETNPASLSIPQLESWNHEGKVEWVGYVEDVPALIASSHVIVLPSYREGFPRVLIEAAASGRPVVTADVPGCRHAILKGKTGLLVPVCDAEALARAMGQIAEDRDLRTQMGIRARQLAEEKYAIKAVVDTHLDIYQAKGQ
jgi:glycosyltransferase involved in cell wall biosynthesis